MDPDDNKPAPEPGAEPRSISVERPPREDEMPLPFERDESPDAVGEDEAVDGPRQVIDQAARDIGRGLVDTDRRGTPSDVPGPGPAAEHSPGADVPEDGVDVAGHSQAGERARR